MRTGSLHQQHGAGVVAIPRAGTTASQNSYCPSQSGNVAPNTWIASPGTERVDVSGFSSTQARAAIAVESWDAVRKVLAP